MGGLPVVRLMATRLALRDRPPDPRVRRLLIGSTLATAVGVAGVIAGSSSLVFVAVAGVASMLALTAIALRFFPPAMAVSVIGVALSCASLMTALSVTTGFQLEIQRAMGRLNGHVLLTKYGLDFYEYEEIADAWADDPRVSGVSPFAYSMVAVVGGVSEREAKTDADRGRDPDDRNEDEWGDDDWGADVAADEPMAAQDAGRGPAVVIGKGIDPKRASGLAGMAQLLGRGDLSALRPADTFERPGIVLGTGLGRILGVGVGDFVRVVVPAEIDGKGALGRAPRHAIFEVLDLLQTGTSEFDRNLVLMHISAAQALFFKKARVTGIEFQLHDANEAESVALEITASLPAMYRTSTWKETNSAMLIGLEQIRLTISLVLGLMVIVAASSLIASLLLIVRRKRHDIAVLLALGADRGLVFWVFEGVGVFAGLVGAALGLALGGLYCAVIEGYRYPLGGDVYPVDHLPVVIRAVDALGPAVAAVTLCALATGPVAVLATRVGVIAALRR